MLFEISMMIIGECIPSRYSALLRTYVNSVEIKKVMIEQDTDLLTHEEILKHRNELRTWIDHNCFKRHPRKGANIIVDVLWVMNWTWVDSKDLETMTRIIRALLTLRGFKDLDKGSLQTFFGNRLTTGSEVGSI